ncbi:NUDIX hydrolase [Paenibacillus athensensis]|uniref:ADP-ribose pyrophosphatase n=1 Tax=Paenibacillus athensensis TaxID=1967502 RepID=A0A4Y8PQM9_9BACL|nr:NUDIX domain-containing protein [Paenibacillus athensensis]MCD1259441.1 NUDIX hydrolase [Paenibacillus athensensis]
MTLPVPRDRNGMSEAEFLAQYDAARYARPSVAVDMVVLTVADQAQPNYRKLPAKKLQLLLIRRGEHPYLGQWALPGGFVSVDESLDEAARRELHDETGIADIYLQPLAAWGEVDRDPRTRVISCSYLALVDSTQLPLQAGTDAADAQWFQLSCTLVEQTTTQLPTGMQTNRLYLIELTGSAEEACPLPLTAEVRRVDTAEGKRRSSKLVIESSNGLAFDHAKIIYAATERLKQQIEHTDIAFQLMPERFTLSALQQVYEIIGGKELLAAAFRRKIAPLVEETDATTRDAGHRPSRLYRFNPFAIQKEFL